MENKKENKILKAKIYCESVQFDESGDYSLTSEIAEEIEADSFEELVENLKYASYTWLEWSSSHPGRGDWLVSESQLAMYSGVYESYTCHFEEVLTDTQIKRITKALNL